MLTASTTEAPTTTIILVTLRFYRQTIMKYLRRHYHWHNRPKLKSRWLKAISNNNNNNSNCSNLHCHFLRVLRVTLNRQSPQSSSRQVAARSFHPTKCRPKADLLPSCRNTTTNIWRIVATLSQTPRPSHYGEYQKFSHFNANKNVKQSSMLANFIFIYFWSIRAALDK